MAKTLQAVFYVVGAALGLLFLFILSQIVIGSIDS